MDIKEINETLEAAKEYHKALRKLDNDLEKAELQILDTGLESSNKIELMFTSLIETLNKCLNNRKKELVDKIEKIKFEALAPLKESRVVISEKIHETAKLIDLGTDLKQNCSFRNINDFNEKARHLGSLPEVPALKEVPFITFQCDEGIEKELKDICSNIGAITRIAPVQINSAIEKPGSLLIEWKVNDYDDLLCDIQAFKLQKVFGNVLKDQRLEKCFSDCFVGSESQFLVRDLQVNQDYSFRVCCKYEGNFPWSQWSIPHVGKTTIKRFSWQKNNDFILTNENTIAKSAIDSPSILFSDGAMLQIGYSVEFTFLECDSENSKVYIGISPKNSLENITDLINSSFVMEANGAIYINGFLKSTKLPEIKKGSKVCFTCEKAMEEKIRINIDCSDKRVTYDWQVITRDKLYFFATVNSSKWKIMVE